MKELSELLAEHVAAGLSERQRAALLWLPADASSRFVPKDYTFEARTLFEIQASPDIRVRLVYARMAGTSPGMALTELGARVRAIVERETKHER